MLLNEYITLLNVLNLTFNPHFYRFMYFAIQNYYFASLFILFKGLFNCQYCYKIIFITLVPLDFYFIILFQKILHCKQYVKELANFYFLVSEKNICVLKTLPKTL